MATSTTTWELEQIEYLNLEDIDFDEDIPLDSDYITDEEEGIVIEEEDFGSDFENVDDDDEEITPIPTIVFVDQQQGIQEINDNLEHHGGKKPSQPTGKTFTCAKCGKLYKRESFYKKHEEICLGKSFFTLCFFFLLFLSS